MAERKNNQESFKVKDARRFNPDGTVKQGSDREDPGDENKQDSKQEKQQKPREETAAPPEDFEINFPTFILSLASSVQISLGLIPHPMTNKSEVNLPSAKQTIDILGMLEEKTRGNLTAQEEDILKRLLYELRMHYVEVVNKAKGGGHAPDKK